MLIGSPLDSRGCLHHPDDPAAQLLLAWTRLAAALADAGLRPADLTELRVITADVAALAGVLEVLTDRLEETFAAPRVDVVAVARLGAPGQLVTLETVLHATSKELA